MFARKSFNGRGGTKCLKLAVTGLLCVAPGLACGVSDILNPIVDPLNNIVSQMNKAIASLNNQGADFQLIIRDLIADLPAAENDLKNDLDELLQRALGGAQTELIATSDFFSRRMSEGLHRLIAKITGEPYIVPPAFINFVPDKVEYARVGAELNSITVFGYDFDLVDPQGEGLKLKLLKRGGFSIFDPALVQGDLVASKSGKKRLIRDGFSEVVDVTHALALPTHYKAVFNLGSNGVPLTDQSDQLQLVWNNEVIATLPVIQPPPVQPREEIVQLASISYFPPKVYGDREFDGSGPAVYVKAEIFVSGDNKLMGRVWMQAQETEDDWTTAAGWSTPRVLYTPPEGVHIRKILSPTSAEGSYVDNNHSQDILTMAPGDIVTEFVCVGDTASDNDAGTATSVNVHFDLVKLEVLGE